MPPVLFLSGRSIVDRAEILQRDHGSGAATAARVRALAARANDNAVMFCQWRDVERLCGLPVACPPEAKLH